jgi:hypothetical protein
MEEKWKRIYPNEPSDVEYMEVEKADSALVNNNIKVIFIFLGVGCCNSFCHWFVQPGDT